MKIPEKKNKGSSRQAIPGALLIGFALLAVSLWAAGQAFAADCPDNDKDGYVVCSGGCTVPEGLLCGDCADNDPGRNPGVAEFCGDNIDNNCDGIVDFNAGQECQIGFPAGCTEPSQESPCCLTASVLVCNAQGDGVVCQTPEAPLEQPEPEQAYTAACHDGSDNDCDGLYDQFDPGCAPTLGELCNGLDDNYNEQVDEGFNLGQDCTVGEGACARSGETICDGEFASKCSATAAGGKPENTPGTGVCIDGIDNDCDGLIDLADPNCQSAEICDGLDNNGNGQIDEDFPELGQPCTSGLGACASEGTFICSPDGQSTVCSATAGLASVEGPTGPTCSDGIDNDCDGYTDGQDQSCGSADLFVACALPYYQGKKYPDFESCVGLHRILFLTNADLKNNPNAKLTAELLAMDKDGSILASIPVNNWDLARLASRKDKEDWIVQSFGSVHKVFAPRPVLHVAVDDGLNKAEAFCSDIPFVQMLEPKGKVVSSSEGDTTRLYATIPLVSSQKVKVLVDGVDLFQGLSIPDPSQCTFQSPCAGTLYINGQLVTVTDIVVQSSILVGGFGANILDARLSGLGCGEHLFKVSGIKRFGAFPNTPDEQCLIDDLVDTGNSSGLDITIDSPEDYSVLAEGSVNVVGSACSGREISDVSINGQLVDISGQVYTEGDGETKGDRYDVAIDSTHFVTNLAKDTTSGDELLGTFDPGSNKLTAQVTDDLGNRSYDEKMFAIGETALPAVQASLQKSLQEELLAKIKVATQSAMTEVDNAYVVGMSKDAIQEIFNNRCVAAGKEFQTNLQARITAGWQIFSKKIEVSVCSCDPTVKGTVTSVSLDPNAITCPVDFQNDKMKVTVNLPDVTVNVGISGYCRVGDPVFDICISKTNVSGSTHVDLTGARMEFDITEGQLLGTAAPNPPVFFPPVASDPPTVGIHASIHCLSTLCDILLTPIAAVVNLIAGENLIPVIGFGQTIDVHFEADVGSSAPDPIQLGDIKVNEQEVQGTGQKTEGTLSSVQITPNGLVAGLKGSFETLSVDPEVEPTLGAVLTPAPLPVIPVSNADDIFFGLADDTFNQFFASMAVSGKLKTGCNATGKTVGDLLPIDCATLSVGQCSNDAAVSCKQDSDCGGGTCQENALKTGIAKGACYGFKGADCTTLPLGQRLVCNATQDKLAAINISASQPLLFCMRQDIPPRLLIDDDAGTTSEVETSVRLNDLSVALIVDRDGNGQLDGELSSTYRCFADGAPTIGDCNFFGACLDLNIETAMRLAAKECQADPSIICTNNGDCASVGGSCVNVCDGGEPGFSTRVKSVQPTIRSLGVVCGGATATGDDDLLANTSGQDTTIDILLDNANRFTPPACIQGLSNDFMTFENPRLISIEADGDPTFGDYLGITGEVK